jgi:hypothetical protein
LTSAAIGRSEAGRAATPAEAKAIPVEHRPADPAPAQAKVQPAALNEPGPDAPSRSPRRLIIPLIAVGAAVARVLVTSARWDDAETALARATATLASFVRREAKRPVHHRRLSGRIFGCHRRALADQSDAGSAGGPAHASMGEIAKLPCWSPSASRSMTSRTPRNWRWRARCSNLATNTAIVLAQRHIWFARRPCSTNYTEAIMAWNNYVGRLANTRRRKLFFGGAS